MKFKSKYGKYLTRVEITEKELKQAYSIYFGQISDEMKASLKEDPDFERAFQEKDVLALRKMLKNTNYNYKQTEEPFKTLVMATKDLMNLKQIDSKLQDYFTKFEATRKLVDELHSSDYGSPFIDIICRERKLDPDGLSNDDKKKIMDDGEERISAIQLLLNADRKRYGALVEKFVRAYLGGNNRFPKTVNEAYNLLKNWNRNPDQPQQRNPNRVGVSFNTIGDEGSDGKPKCARCGRDNHTIEQCVAKKHLDGTMLHTMGGLDGDIYPEVSNECAGPRPVCGPGNVIDFYCGNELEEPMFLQPHVNGYS